MENIKPSPALHCKLRLSDDYIDTFISPKERLILDVSKYVKEQNTDVLTEIRDSLLAFGMLVSWPFYWKASKLNTITWKDDSIQEDTEVSHSDDDNQRCSNDSIDDLKIESIDDLLFQYFRQNYTTDEEGIPKDECKLNKEKLSSYPNIYTILDYLQNKSSIQDTEKILFALYLVTNQKDKAISIYRKMKQKNAYDYYNLGTIYLTYKKDYQMAIEQYKKALGLKEAQYNLGIAYLREDNLVDAESQFKQLAEPFDIKNIEIKSVNGILFDHAIKQYACNNMGFCYYKADRFREAFEWFDKAIEWSTFTDLPCGVSNKLGLINVMKELIKSTKQIEVLDGFQGIIGKSAKMQKIFDSIQKVASTNTKVLITGETGTEKELVAKAIHELSGRKGQLISENCSDVTESLEEDWLFGHQKGGFTGAKDEKAGIFEQADGGTLFLDEIGDMRLGLQAKFLRVIEDKKIKRLGSEGEAKDVDVRIICTTNKDLKGEVEAGGFREDLYYCINVFPIHLSPLRERREDIPLLIDHFISKFAESIPKSGLSISPSAHKLLEKYDWPDNIREFKNVIERSATIADGNIIINIVDLRRDEDAVKMRTTEALELEKGNITKAAKYLRVTRQTVHKHIKRFGIDTVKKDKKLKTF